MEVKFGGKKELIDEKGGTRRRGFEEICLKARRAFLSLS
jgi:hypothetical protein